jgi:hypothetical protein
VVQDGSQPSPIFGAHLSMMVTPDIMRSISESMQIILIPPKDNILMSSIRGVFMTVPHIRPGQGPNRCTGP